jgi:hypothetical protein
MARGYSLRYTNLFNMCAESKHTHTPCKHTPTHTPGVLPVNEDLNSHLFVLCVCEGDPHSVVSDRVENFQVSTHTDKRLWWVVTEKTLPKGRSLEGGREGGREGGSGGEKHEYICGPTHFDLVIFNLTCRNR